MPFCLTQPAVRTRLALPLLFGWLTSIPVELPAQQPPSGPGNSEWRSYAGDLRNFHYAPLDQINAGNFNQLEIAWRFKTDSLGNRPEFKLETTPLMVNGGVYATAGSRRGATAPDAATGELL